MTAQDARLETARELFDIAPLQPNIGAEIGGVDLTRPLDPAVRDGLRAALLAYRVIFFRDQDMTHTEHIAFGRSFGELEVHPVFALPGTPEILPLKAENHIANKRGSANAAWHADTTMRQDPSAASILRSRISPAIGGDTVFSNMVLGYDLLDDEVKERIDGLTAFHDAQVFLNYLSDEKRDEVMADWPGVEHPVVRVHPETGEKAIYVNSIFTRRITGVAPEESEALLRILFDQVKLPELQCRFAWRTNSVAFWDNRSCQHYGVNDYVGERHMERVTIAGDVPFGPTAAR
jgi:taurine dioxygenase